MSAALWPHVLTLPRPGGGQLVMRALRPRDRDEWEALRDGNAARIARWESEPPVPGRRLGFRRLVSHYDAAGRSGTMQPFVIQWGPRLVGQMHLSGIAWGAQLSGTAGYWVAERYTGLGVAPMCLAALVDHAFGLGLHRVEVNIRPENTASLRVVEKLGFRDEGIRRRLLHVQGEWRDHRSFAVTTEDLGGSRMFDAWYAARSRQLSSEPE